MKNGRWKIENSDWEDCEGPDEIMEKKMGAGMKRMENRGSKIVDHGDKPKPRRLIAGALWLFRGDNSDAD